VNKAEYRYVAGAKRLIITPLYVDDELLAPILLGAHAKRWSDIRPMLEREGMRAIVERLIAARDSRAARH
jgi:hypothetical protein